MAGGRGRPPQLPNPGGRAGAAVGLPSPELRPQAAPTVAQSPAPSARPPPGGGSLGPHAARAAGCVSSSSPAPSGRRWTAPGPRPGHQPWKGAPGSKFHIRGRLPSPRLGQSPGTAHFLQRRRRRQWWHSPSSPAPRYPRLVWGPRTREASAAAPRVARSGPGGRGEPAVLG